MKYFLDTEFLEGTQKSFFGITRPTIDLISIGLVAEDGREYYAISKEFNIKEAWNRYDIETNEYTKGFGYEKEVETNKVYWIRDNVLRSIYNELANFHITHFHKHHKHFGSATSNQKYLEFTFSNLKWLIETYGKTNKQIAEEIKEYIYPKIDGKDATDFYLETKEKLYRPEFYGYYSDYDWVVFCWLFGKMIDLPKGFPMYCIDLKQMLDQKCAAKYPHMEYDDRLKQAKNHPYYPMEVDAHNALVDAKWNSELYKFINFSNSQQWSK